MRGKHVVGVHDAVEVRIIPAHAGQTSQRTRPQANGTDHPRACGANHSSRAPTVRHGGSSPRMRGKPGRYGRTLAGCRIIPAHAGQTSGSFWIGDGVSGSSPRMRGKHCGAKIKAIHGRIIPAHAGQTQVVKSWRVAVTDHPRACGANSLIPLAKHSPAML